MYLQRDRCAWNGHDSYDVSIAMDILKPSELQWSASARRHQTQSRLPDILLLPGSRFQYSKMPTVQNAPPGQIVDGVRLHLLPTEFDTGPADRADAANQSVKAKEAAKGLEKLIGLVAPHVIICRDDAELKRIQSLLIDKSFKLSENNKGTELSVWYTDLDTRRLKTDQRLRIADFDHGQDTSALRTHLETISRDNILVRTTLGPTPLSSAQFRVAAANPIKNRKVVVFIPFDELSRVSWLAKGWMKYAARDGAGDGYEKVRKLMNADE